MSFICKLFTLLILNTILNHLNKLDYVTITSGITTHQLITSHFVTSALPNIIFAGKLPVSLPSSLSPTLFFSLIKLNLR